MAPQDPTAAELPVDALLEAGERWYGFLQQRFEEARRMPKYHRMLGESYGRFVVHAERGDQAAMDHLEWLRTEAQQFNTHPDFPGGPVEDGAFDVFAYLESDECRQKMRELGSRLNSLATRVAEQDRSGGSS
jgi:hypothetical protein